VDVHVCVCAFAYLCMCVRVACIGDRACVRVCVCAYRKIERVHAFVA
jgi:hypothetical protein